MEIETREKLLNEEQVDAVMQFSQGLYSLDHYGFYSPWLQNDAMQSLNNNAKVATIDKIKDALADYRNNADSLQDYTEFMQKWSDLFNRTISYYAGMLSFDLQIVCKNAFTNEEYESDQYQRDKRVVYNFLDNFDYKAEFAKVVKEVLRHETYYTWFRKTKWHNKNMKFALQVLPQKHCMLTGYWEKGLLFDFDMNYFLRPGVDINGFDPAFKRYFNNIFGLDRNTLYNYNPNAPLKDRNGTYAYWTQTSPDDGAWAFKMDLSNFNSTPYLVPLLKSALRSEDLAELQYNKDIAGAYAILAGEIRLLDKNLSGDVHDQFAINPKLLGKFMREVKNGLPKEYKAVAMPTENIKMFQYQDGNTNAFKNQLKTTGGLGASASRLLYADDRMSNAEIENAILTDYNIMRPLYSQFSNFLNYYVNKLTQKYKFDFIFDGSNYEFERNKRFDRALKVADKGMVFNSSYYASVLGIKPQTFERSLMEGHSDPNFRSNLSMLLNVNTSKNGADPGRPKKDPSELTESGEASQMY